ncbi:hypothetical protein CI109_105953 [Kwoniella shandongensis]|uniref:Uncharacterized protein n=1 Tax=Kwoniella shandongensis TaxID=1734106 RepID=A0A5M6BZR6_9TREE|nr:uncharacterized protein CI109_003999 [Kwoniella shandongensis]KAA5527740.1 hypothetical protein CI109_003999 [Kwoniella shandongensis]
MSTSPATHESYLVVGGCGFLGRHIVEQLLGRGETQVSVFDIVQRHFDSNVTFYIGDLSKPEDVENALHKSKATVIIHTASPTHGMGRAIYEKVNVTGTRTLLDAALSSSSSVRKVVYTSSGGVIYSGSEDIVNVDERIDYPAQPLDAYNETKVAAEKMVLAANGEEGLLTCAIRPAGIFGPGDRQMINGFYEVVKNGQTKWQIGNNSNLGDFTYVGNVAHAHLLAADKLGTKYPYSSLRDPIKSIDISLGEHRIPTSQARPIGPNTNPSEEDLAVARKFESGQVDESDLRPVLRTKMDHFSAQSSLADEEDESGSGVSAGGIDIAGQAYFITNGEPIYFWDFARTIWRQLGHVPAYVIVLPTALGLILATLAELFSKFSGKEPGFTRFRVSQATQQRFYDIEKARRLLGYEPVVGLDDGMNRWTSWYRGELEKQREVQENEKTK